MRLRVNLKVEYAEFEAQAVPPHLFQYTEGSDPFAAIL